MTSAQQQQRRVNFSQAIVMNQDEPENVMTDLEYYSQCKARWFTESELTVIELENHKECREKGLSRGLELIYDDLCDHRIETRQQEHTRTVVRQQNHTQDAEAIRKLSKSLTRDSRTQAEERGATDAIEVYGELLSQHLEPSLNFGCFPARPTPLPGYRPGAAA